MEPQILSELEIAAKVILAPPTVVSNDQRPEAEAVFVNFRRTKSPYHICKYIFENSTIPYVIFETCNALKEAIIREWGMMAQDDINSIRDYLLQYVLNKQDVAIYVREKILQVIAIMIKRGSLVDRGEERRKILMQIEQMIVTGELKKQTLGCSIVSAIMQEYAVTIKSADVGLTWETHLSLKDQFEKTDLKMIFQMCTRMLNDLSKIEGLSEDMMILLKSLLQIAEATLTWSFILPIVPKVIICLFESSYESDFYISLKPGMSWKDIIMDPELIHLFFLLHWKIRNNAQVTYLTLNCLIQLASVSGPLMAQRDRKETYVKNYMHHFLNFIQCAQVVDREAVGISNIFVKLVMLFDTFVLEDPTFIQQMTRLTCHFIDNAALYKTYNCDEAMFTEAFDNMLKAWITVSNNETRIPPDVYCASAKCIFDAFLRWHLSPPHGTRTNEAEDEVQEIEEDDATKYELQLQTIAMFGKRILSYSLPTIIKLIEEKTSELRMVLQGSANNLKKDDLFEDLHWIIMLAGNIVVERKDYESFAMAQQVLRHSMERASSVSLDDSLRLITMTKQSITSEDFDRLEQTVDHIIWLTSAVFRLCELENQMMEAKLTHLLSPTLMSTVVSFLSLWTVSYLKPNESLYPDVMISFPISSAFDRNPECVAWILNFLLKKIQLNICSNSDKLVMENTSKLLLSLASSKKTAADLLKINGFWEIISYGMQSNGRFVSADVRKMIAKAFAVTIAVEKHDPLIRDYLDQVVSPITTKFRNIVTDTNFKAQYHNDAVRMEIMDIVNYFIGIVEGCGVTTCHYIFEYLCIVLHDLVTLTSIYANYQQVTQLVLEFGCSCARVMTPFFIRAEARAFYQFCLHLVGVYVKNNAGRSTQDASAEEESLQDLLYFIELLSNLLNKEIIDLSPFREPPRECDVRPIEVCVSGIRGILPLMSPEALKVPLLCRSFFALLNLVCSLHAEYLLEQPQEFLTNILAIIELGLTGFNIDATATCCEFIQTLATHICLHASTIPADRFTLLEPFLKLMTSLMFSKQVSPENVKPFGLAFHSLMCCYKDSYVKLVQDLVSSQSDTEVSRRLSDSFNKLNDGLLLQFDRKEKIHFEKSFEQFLIDVQGFLLVK